MYVAHRKQEIWDRVASREAGGWDGGRQRRQSRLCVRDHVGFLEVSYTT